MGLNEDLKLQANEFSNVATVFFAAYLIGEIPTGEIGFRQRSKYCQLDTN